MEKFVLVRRNCQLMFNSVLTSWQKFVKYSGNDNVQWTQTAKYKQRQVDLFVE